VVLFLLLTPRAPAQGLARTLRAMAQLQSAHCSGWHVNYRVSEGELRPTPARLPVEWWYRAPDRYREAAGPARSREDVPSFLLVVRGDKNVLTRRSPAGLARRDVLPPAALIHYL